MKRICLVAVFILVFVFGNTAFAAETPTKEELEWELSARLIENYKGGRPELRINADLNKISPLRIYAYVYAVVPERLNIKTNERNQEIWIEVLPNQNHKNTVEIAKNVISTITTKNMSDLEKIAAIHDWIVLNTTFASEETLANSIINENIWAFSADGVFTRGTAVCSGYAAAFQALCQEAEITCFTINSRIKSHTWNAVYYEDAWRFIDASSETRASQTIDIASIYGYFMLNENELPKTTHEFDASSENSLTAKEYIDFFNYYTRKPNNSSAKSIHTKTMELLAAKQNVYAMFQLGVCYQNGLYGFQKDDKKCFEWQYNSARLGHTVSQNNIGYFYKNGLGVLKDYEKAFEWYSKAATNGYAYSQVQMGHFYREGMGVKKDTSKAKFWYQKAANQGNLDAIEMLRKL